VFKTGGHKTVGDKTVSVNQQLCNSLSVPSVSPSKTLRVLTVRRSDTQNATYHVITLGRYCRVSVEWLEGGGTLPVREKSHCEMCWMCVCSSVLPTMCYMVVHVAHDCMPLPVLLQGSRVYLKRQWLHGIDRQLPLVLYQQHV
jgi:hypothetical protein